jgi:AAA ATPase domain
MRNEYQVSGEFSYYQNANAGVEAIKKGFLVRQFEYSVILQDLVRNSGRGAVQHYLVYGSRGSGKSTLLRRIQVEIDTNQELMSSYIAVNLAEEQANIYRLFDLLEEVVRELEYRHFEIEWPEDDDTDAYTRALFFVIHKALDKAGKRLVLLLDNIDRIFENLGDDTASLRACLQNYGDIKIIGGSTRMTEHFWSYNQPFYEFFRVLRLSPLDREEIRCLLASWGEQLNTPLLKEFIEKRPGQLETVRILTDGLPRTLQFFVDILLTENPQTGFDYVRRIMDKVTPLYQERLNHLPPAQRKIVLQLAFFWEAVGAGDLARATRMENRVVSAQLAQLIEKKVAEKIETKTKNHLYRLSERFFNLWLIFTQGSPSEKRRARYLTVFLETFYDAQRVNELAVAHLGAVKEGVVGSDKAALLTKAYSQSIFIPFQLRNELIEVTRRLPGIPETLIKELPLTTNEILAEAHELEKSKQWDKAEKLVATIEQENGLKEYVLGTMAEARDDMAKAEEYLQESVRRGFGGSAVYLASLYIGQGKLDLAEEFAEIGFRLRSVVSIRMLVLTYYLRNKHKSKALELIKMGMQVGEESSCSYLLPVIKVWNGVFDDLEGDMLRLIREDNEFLGFTLINLLGHYQDAFVQRLFEGAEFGMRLTEKFYLPYCAMRVMQPDGWEFGGRIAPEFRDTVRGLISHIVETQDRYHKKRAKKRGAIAL